MLKIGDVFVDGGERAEAQSTGDLFIGGGVSVLLGEAGQEVDDLFLSPCDSHAGIVANKKRIEKLFSKFICGGRSWVITGWRGNSYFGIRAFKSAKFCNSILDGCYLCTKVICNSE